MIKEIIEFDIELYKMYKIIDIRIAERVKFRRFNNSLNVYTLYGCGACKDIDNHVIANGVVLK
jgi:hypothetical protein